MSPQTVKRLKTKRGEKLKSKLLGALRTVARPFKKEATPITYEEGEDLFEFIDRVAYGKNKTPKKQQDLIRGEINRGTNILNEIFTSPQQSVSPSLIQHAKDIRAACWSLYKQSFDKKQAFVGGMIVLEDGGKMFDYLTRGECVSNQSGADKIMADPQARYVPHYKRGSTHFGKRRDNSMGMDFYSFTDHSGKKPQKDKSIKLPLQKETLHFGTLDKGLLTFIKFEYFGTLSVGKKIGHGITLIKKEVRPELGSREDGGSEKFYTDIQALLKKYDAGEKLEKIIIEVPDEDDPDVLVEKEYELRDGAFFAQVVILHKIEPGRREAALMELKELIDEQEGMTTEHSEIRQGNEVIFSKDQLGIEQP